MNDRDRAQWIDNDEGLYTWWKSTRLSQREFIRKHRPEIDRIIVEMTSGRRRQHYLVYDKKKGPLHGLGGLGTFQGDKDIGATRWFQSHRLVLRVRFIGRQAMSIIADDSQRVWGVTAWLDGAMTTLRRPSDYKAHPDLLPGEFSYQPLIAYGDFEEDVYKTAEGLVKTWITEMKIPREATSYSPTPSARFPLIRRISPRRIGKPSVPHGKGYKGGDLLDGLGNTGDRSGDKDVGTVRIYQSDQTIIRVRYLGKGAAGALRGFALSYGVLGHHSRIRDAEQTQAGLPGLTLEEDMRRAAENYLRVIVHANFIPINVTNLQYSTQTRPILRLVHKADVRYRGMAIDGLRTSRSVRRGRCHCR